MIKLIHMFQLLSPNMLKTFEQCQRKFDFKYLRNIQMPVNNDIFEFGKNIHALASYYLKKENIDKMEQSLSNREKIVWEYLKSSEYFSYDVINTEYNLSVKVGNSFFGGRLDALVKNGDKYYILDYKTGDIPRNTKYDYQTMIYILCVKEFFKTDNICFVYIDLRKRENVKIEFTPDIEKEYKERLISISKRIEQYDKIDKKQECNCEYSIICY